MNVKRLILFSICLLPPATSFSAESPGSCQASVSLPETVELALIVAGISPLGRDNNNVINRDSAYFADVDKHFGGYSDHRLISALGPDFNLPRLVGNATDFAFDEDDQLIEIDKSGSLWGDSENDLFRRHFTLIADFAKETEFREFFSDNQSVYGELVDRTAAAIDIARMRCWLEANFTAVPGKSHVHVSPLMANFHWTTLYKPEHRLWVSGAPQSGLDDNLSRMLYGRAIFTELDHPFVNPVTAKHVPTVEAAFENGGVWVSHRAGESYPSGELQFNEYMTFSVFLMFAADHLPAPEFAELKEEVVALMAERRGFIAFEAFAAEALRRYRNDGVIAEMLIPPMIEWCAAYADTQ